MMALSGIGAMLFLIVHLGDNLLFYAGPETLNAFAHLLHSLPILPLIEAGLAAVFILHIVFSILVTLENKKARDVPYAVTETAGESTLASRTMMISGFVILLFLLFHLWSMKWSHFSELLAYERIVTVLSNPVYALLYIIGILVVGFHLSHGTSSSLQSMGLRFPQYEKEIKFAGKAFAGFITLGFVSIPIYIQLCF